MFSVLNFKNRCVKHFVFLFEQRMQFLICVVARGRGGGGSFPSFLLHEHSRDFVLSARC